MNKSIPKNIDGYVDRFPQDVQRLLKQMRLTIQQAAPKAAEAIGYGIPMFRLDGYLVYFAAFKNHVGFYPGAAAIKAFKAELSAYKSAKGSVQFPLGEPLPLALVRQIVKFRVQQNLGKKKRK